MQDIEDRKRTGTRLSNVLRIPNYYDLVGLHRSAGTEVSAIVYLARTQVTG